METSAGDTGRSTRRALRELLHARLGLVAFVAACTLLAAVTEAVFLAIVTQSILTIAAGNDSFTLLGSFTFSISGASVVSLVLIVTRFVLLFATIRVQSSLFEGLLVDLRSRLGRDYLHTNWPTQSRFQRGLLQQLVVQFPASIVSLVYQLMAALTGGLALLALLAVAFVIEPLTALVVFGLVIALATGILPIRRAVKQRAARALHDQTTLATTVSEMADLSLEITVMNVAGASADQLDRLVAREARSQRHMGFFRDLVNPVYTTLAFGAIVLAVVVLREFGTSDLQATGSVLLIMLRSLSYGQQLQHGASALGQISPALEQLADQRTVLLDQRRQRGSRAIEAFSTLALQRVSFSYDERPVLHDVSLSVGRGEIVGIVGPSGAGKTTLVNIVLGLLDPSSGTVLVDDTATSDISADSWSRLVAHVPQETRLLDGTIADNVRFLRPGLSDHDIDRALTGAGLTLDWARFPAGITTDVGTAGRAFSGGQKQRLAIARALVTHPSLLVLDEPTSALDTESDEAVVDTLRRLRGSVAVIVVSHRDTTLAACDRVIAVADGRVTTVR